MTLDSGTLRVLLVEDEEVNRALVRAVITRLGVGEVGTVELREVSTLAEARAAVREGRTDVVLLDIRLPDGSGLDLLAEELAEPGAPGRPRVIVMSASVLPADREAARRSGSDAFLGKPFMPMELIAMLRRFAGATTSD